MHVFSLLKLYKPFVFILSSLHPTPKWQFLLCSIHHLLWHTCNLTVTFRTNCIGVPVFKLHIIFFNIVDFRHVASRRGGGVVGSWLSTFPFHGANIYLNFTHIKLNYSGVPLPHFSRFQNSLFFLFSFCSSKFFLMRLPPPPLQTFKKMLRAWTWIWIIIPMPMFICNKTTRLRLHVL